MLQCITTVDGHFLSCSMYDNPFFNKGLSLPHYSLLRSWHRRGGSGLLGALLIQETKGQISGTMTAQKRKYIYSGRFLTVFRWSSFRNILLLSHFSRVQLCATRDGSPPGSPVPGILQARTLEWVAISFSNAWKWKVKVKSLSHVRLFETPWTTAYQAPPSMGFCRKEYWSGVQEHPGWLIFKWSWGRLRGLQEAQSATWFTTETSLMLLDVPAQILACSSRVK